MDKISVLLLAGGKGLRMNTDLPKQYLSLGGKAVALHSYEVLKDFGEVIVVASPEFHPYFPADKVLFAMPGDRRQDSVFNALKIASGEIILVHDAARPFINKEDVEKLLAALKDCDAAALATPLTSTLKRVNPSLEVEETLSREALWKVHTPQVVLREVLEKGFLKAHHEALTVTDDLSLAELVGARVKLVQGGEANIKITTPEDLAWAQWRLEREDE